MRTLLLLLACAAGARPDMSRIPAPGPLRPYRAPPRREFTLSNGLPVVLIEDRRFPLVDARLAVRGGKGAEEPEDAGLAEAMAELLAEGTSIFSAKEIAARADEMGGGISASADQDAVEVEGFSLSEHAGKLFSLLAQVSLDPAFRPEEVALRKANMLEELQIDRSNPEFLASVALHRELYPGHPYGIVAPTEESIARITARKLAALHERLFIPENALMVVAGDIGEDKLKRLLEAGFGSWKTGGSPLEPLPAPEQPRGRGQVAVVDRPGSEQAVLLLGVPAVPRDHPDYFPLLVANQILGGSFGARLNMDLRERRGLTYGAYSSLETARSAGALLVDTQVPNKAVGKALKGIEKHLERLRKEPPTAEELARAKNMLAGSFARHLETQAGVADAVADALLDGLPGNYLDDYLERVDAVSAQDVLRAASARLPPGGAVIAVVGDAAKLRLDGAPRISPPARKI